jgi:hypothetical protein
MKIVITENRLEKLAIKFLNNTFPNFYEDVNYTTDSVGEHKRIEYRAGDGVIMIYGFTNQVLYICGDIVDVIRVIFEDLELVKKIVKKWFEEKFELPVKIMRIVDKNQLN